MYHEQAEDNIQVVNEEDFEEHEQDEGCSGGTKKTRRFTLQEKLMYLRVICQKVDKGLSLWEASKSMNGRMKNKNNQHAKSLGDGVTSFLSLYTDNLLSLICEMRETGMAVSVNSIVLKASQLSREFREKTYTARHSAMHRFINVHGFMHQMGTHLSQHQPSEMEEIAADFVCVTHGKLQMSYSDEAYIIDMDQTPVPFSYGPKNHRSGWMKDNSYQEVDIQYKMCYMCFDCYCIGQNDNTSLCFQRLKQTVACLYDEMFLTLFCFF